MKTRNLVASALALAAGAGIAFWYFASSNEAGRQAANSRERPPLSVTVVKAERGTVQSWVFAEGTARSVRREYLIFNNQGRVEFIAKTKDGQTLREGDFVRAKQLLARQDQRLIKSEIASATAALQEARTQVEVAKAQLVQAQSESRLAQDNLARKQTLRRRGVTPQAQLNEAQSQAEVAKTAIVRAESQVQAAHSKVASAQARLEKAKVPLEDTELIAPIDGQIAYLNINEGDYYLPSIMRTDTESNALKTVPIVVIDPDNFEIRVQIPSYERGRIKVGQTAYIARGAANAQGRAAATGPVSKGENVIAGKVYSVTPAVDPSARGIDVKIRTNQARKSLQDGVYVTVWIAANERRNVVVAPFNAIVYSDNRPLVFVADRKAGIVRRVAVRLGLRSFDKREIVSGVEVGQLLVTTGRHQLTDGAPIRIIEAGARKPVRE